MTSNMVRSAALGALAFGFVAAAGDAKASTYGFTGDFGVDNDYVAITFEVTAAQIGQVIVLRNWGYGGTNTGGVAVDSLNGGEAGTLESTSGNFDGSLQIFASDGALALTNNGTGFRDSVNLPGIQNLNYLAVETKYTVDNGNDPYAVWSDPEFRLIVTDGATDATHLAVGVYTIVLSQNRNLWSSGDVTDGSASYTYSDYPNYTGTNDPVGTQPYNCNNSQYFCDVVAYSATSGYNRDAGYALELYNVDSAELVYASASVVADTPVSGVPLPGAAALMAGALGAFGAAGLRRKRA